MTSQHFMAVLEKDEEVDATRIAIPFNVLDEFGSRARVAVRGVLNGVTFRSSIFPYSGVHYLIVNRALRLQAKVNPGDLVVVELERDDEPRQIAAPADLTAALEANAVAQAVWEKLSYSHRKEYVEAIEAAKKPETRQRRVEKAIIELLEKKGK